MYPPKTENLGVFSKKKPKNRDLGGFKVWVCVKMRKIRKMLEVENIILCDVVFYVLIRNLNLIEHNAVTQGIN